jgi:hypothetical protein
MRAQKDSMTALMPLSLFRKRLLSL